MKRLLIFTAFLAFTAVSFARAGGGSAGGAEITFDQTELHFGSISESGKKVTRDYLFTNTGTSPLVITKVITSCRCTDASYSKRPVAPGQSGKITITYDPKKQRGVFYKAIQVYTNTEAERHIIVAKGEVIP